MRQGRQHIRLQEPPAMTEFIEDTLSWLEMREPKRLNTLRHRHRILAARRRNAEGAQ